MQKDCIKEVKDCPKSKQTHLKKIIHLSNLFKMEAITKFFRYRKSGIMLKVEIPEAQNEGTYLMGYFLDKSHASFFSGNTQSNCIKDDLLSSELEEVSIGEFQQVANKFKNTF